MSPILYRDRGKEGKREKCAVTGGGELFWMSGIDTRVRWSAVYRYKQCLQSSSQSRSHLWAGWAALAPSKAGRMVPVLYLRTAKVSGNVELRLGIFSWLPHLT